jgi:site-specific DNA recombinase
VTTQPVPIRGHRSTEPPADDTVDLYLRKSNKDKLRSVERQLADLTTSASEEGLRIGRVFVDPDFSASRYRRRERPDFAQLTEHIRNGGCRILGIAEVSRGSRDNTEWSGFLDLCRDLDVKIWVSTHERIYDLSRRRDWRALADEGLDAADESEKISERVRSGQRKAAREGKPHGRLKYGFTRLYDETGAFVEQRVHPVHGPIVAEIIQRVADKDPLQAIARDLNKRGVTAPEGGRWIGTNIRQLVIKGHSYVGRRVHQGHDVGQAAWDPIVEVTAWEAAVRVLTQPGRTTPSRGTDLVHWLANTISCGKCRAARLYANPGGQKRPRLTYRCPNCLMVLAGRSTELFIEALLLDRLSEPDAAVAVARGVSDKAEIAQKKEELDNLQSELEQWRHLARTRQVSPVSFAQFEAALLPQIAKADAAWRQVAVPAEHAGLDLTDVPARWPRFSATVKRRYVLAFMDLVATPATRAGRDFDRTRLDESRWVGDSRTWGEIAARAE